MPNGRNIACDPRDRPPCRLVLDQTVRVWHACPVRLASAFGVWLTRGHRWWDGLWDSHERSGLSHPRPPPPNLHLAVAYLCLLCQAGGNNATHTLPAPEGLGFSYERAEDQTEGEAAGHRGRDPARAAGPGPLLQPRAVLAAVQSPRGGGGAEQAPSPAGAAALPVDLGQQHRRVLHGAGGRHL